MTIEHLGIWARDLEKLKDFYTGTFGFESSGLYTNPVTGFQSYFLSLGSGTRLELMTRPDICTQLPEQTHICLAHMAFRLGSTLAVDQMTQDLQQRGVEILSGPRRTGDGYYESVILDPEGNRVELMA